MTLYGTCSTIPMAVISMSRFGEAIQERREVAGYAKQGEAAVASAKLAAEYPELFQAFSQQWLSRLEADETGDAIKKAHPLRMMALAYLLKLDSAEFYERVGVAIATVPLRELKPADASSRGGPPIPPVIPFRETPISIPRELLEMVEQYGEAYPVLKTQQMQRMLAAPRAHGGLEVGPQTAEDWFDYWMANKRFLT